jgi:hypothetical protein
MKIPVFVSCPSNLNDDQQKSQDLINSELEILQFEPRSLGRTDYPTDFPLREVLSIAKHCSGGIILGFSQFETNSGIWKKGIKDKEETQSGLLQFPTPWNQLEAGILFGLQIPVLIFRESFIKGGIFDPEVTDVFIHKMPIQPLDKHDEEALRQVFLKWSARVRRHYYGS